MKSLTFVLGILIASQSFAAKTCVKNEGGSASDRTVGVAALQELLENIPGAIQKAEVFFESEQVCVSNERKVDVPVVAQTNEPVVQERLVEEQGPDANKAHEATDENPIIRMDE